MMKCEYRRKPFQISTGLVLASSQLQSRFTRLVKVRLLPFR